VLLTELKEGARAKILFVHQEENGNRLLELGCVPGEEIIIKTVFPWGGPIAIEVLGYSLAIRREEAKLIDVELL
jgi:ferrous iron transport protein A